MTAVFVPSRFNLRACSAWTGSRWCGTWRLPGAQGRFWWSMAMPGRLVGQNPIAQVGSSRWAPPPALRGIRSVLWTLR